MDRDNDGCITADDIFAAQAQVMQRSEMFIKVRARSMHACIVEVPR